MTAPIWITVAILVGAVALFLSERVRADLVALLVVAAFGLSGVLSPQEAFAGFGNPVIAALLAIFVLAEGLRLSGVAERVGHLLLRFAGTGQRRLLISLMGLGVLLSLVMSNTAAASLLMPAASSAGRRAGVPLSRLLMPLAFATILGGMATLFTTTNLLVSGVLRDHDLAGFGLLDFVPVGLCLVLLGGAYMALGGYRLLPTISAAEHLKGGWRGSTRFGSRVSPRRAAVEGADSRGVIPVRKDPGPVRLSGTLGGHRADHRASGQGDTIAVSRGGPVSGGRPDPGSEARVAGRGGSGWNPGGSGQGLPGGRGPGVSYRGGGRGGPLRARCSSGRPWWVPTSERSTGCRRWPCGGPASRFAREFGSLSCALGTRCYCRGPGAAWR